MNRIFKNFVHLLAIVASTYCLSAQTITEIVEDVGHSVVMIVIYDVTGSVVGQGSGVFISKDGRILTNAHVLEDAYSAEVVSTIGTFDKVQILHKDEIRDLGLIRVPTDKSTPASFTEDTDFKAGQRVIAIGNPLGFEKTVSDGLISGIRRTQDGVELIQTTVPISPGSSGGVLLNEYGLVIGITTSTFEGGQNINFAISFNTILQFLADYRKVNPQGNTFEQLKLAKESVWYRVVLHWVGTIIAVILTLIFGSAFYYVIPILFVLGYIVYGVAKGIWWVVSYPFRKANERKDAQEYQAYLASQPDQDRSSELSPIYEQSEAEIEETDSHVGFNPSLPVVFHCWNCGRRFDLVESTRGQTIECHICHTQLTVPGERISILLPYYLDDTFSSIFASYGFKLIWAQTAEELRRIAQSSQIDLAIEWQHSEQDFPIRNLLRTIGKDTPVFLALNWNGKRPANINALGYTDSLTVPFDQGEMREKFFEVLPPSKRSILTKSQLWTG